MDVTIRTIDVTQWLVWNGHEWRAGDQTGPLEGSRSVAATDHTLIQNIMEHLVGGFEPSEKIVSWILLPNIWLKKIKKFHITTQ